MHNKSYCSWCAWICEVSVPDKKATTTVRSRMTLSSHCIGRAGVMVCVCVCVCETRPSDKLQQHKTRSCMPWLHGIHHRHRSPLCSSGCLHIDPVPYPQCGVTAIIISALTLALSPFLYTVAPKRKRNSLMSVNYHELWIGDTCKVWILSVKLWVGNVSVPSCVSSR